MKYIKALLMALVFVLCLGTGIQTAGGFTCTTAYASPEADENADPATAQTAEADEPGDTTKLIVFMVVILLVCIIAVIVAVSSVTVSLPIIEFFE